MIKAIWSIMTTDYGATDGRSVFTKEFKIVRSH